MRVCLTIWLVITGFVTWSQPLDTLLGDWRCRTNGGVIQLRFVSENELIYNGESSNYQIKPNVIQVWNEFYWVDYPYSLKNDQLVIQFPEGYTLEFKRSGRSVGESGSQKDIGASSQANGRSYLYGKLCEYGSSSSYSTYSSYSHTSWIYFDGQGNCQYGTEGSYSGNTGYAYSGDNGGQSQGSYQINGNKVSVAFQDGTRATFTINMVQDDGRITELKYGEKLFATSLCE